MPIRRKVLVHICDNNTRTDRLVKIVKNGLRRKHIACEVAAATKPEGPTVTNKARGLLHDVEQAPEAAGADLYVRVMALYVRLTVMSELGTSHDGNYANVVMAVSGGKSVSLGFHFDIDPKNGNDKEQALGHFQELIDEMNAEVGKHSPHLHGEEKYRDQIVAVISETLLTAGRAGGKRNPPQGSMLH